MTNKIGILDNLVHNEEAMSGDKKQSFYAPSWEVIGVSNLQTRGVCLPGQVCNPGSGGGGGNTGNPLLPERRKEPIFPQEIANHPEETSTSPQEPASQPEESCNPDQG